MSDKAEGIIQMIRSYTDQIERYENTITWCAVFSVACMLLIIIMVAEFIVKRNKESNNRTCYDGILAGLFLTIPPIITLFLYVFSMNTRKVALYRGYLGFLEQEWNSLMKADIMFFDISIMKDFYLFPSFLVNGIGPVILSVFIILFFALGFIMSMYFLRQMKSSKMKSMLKLLQYVILIICVLFDGLCVYSLSTNDYVSESVIEYCEQQK